MDKLPELLEPWFLFSLIWSVGATCDNDGRKKYSEWLREKMQAENLKMQFPKEGLVYDYLLDDGGIFNTDDNKDEEEEKKVKAV
jgi:dynein heavy chain